MNLNRLKDLIEEITLLHNGVSDSIKHELKESFLDIFLLLRSDTPNLRAIIINSKENQSSSVAKLGFYTLPDKLYSLNQAYNDGLISADQKVVLSYLLSNIDKISPLISLVFGFSEDIVFDLENGSITRNAEETGLFIV